MEGIFVHESYRKNWIAIWKNFNPNPFLTPQ
jgi:hypothetical protein